jgi:transposase InsO family protein
VINTWGDGLIADFPSVVEAALCAIEAQKKGGSRSGKVGGQAVQFLGDACQRLMAKMGLAPIDQRPTTSVPHPEHRVWPCLLRDLVIEQPNQVWCVDLTCIPMRRGLPCLAASMGWASRTVLAWRVPNRMEVEFCLDNLFIERPWRSLTYACV